MFVYIIVCRESLKLYIGQHQGSDLGKYLSRKFYDAHRAYKGYSILYNAMRKYPRETWSIWPLVSGIETRAELDDVEKHFIRVLKTQHPDVGYNICDGGEGRRGPHTEEWRKETLARVKAYWANPENRKKRGEEAKARWASGELREAHAKWAAEHPDELAHWTGKTMSAETRQKISIANKGKQNTLGHKLTAEHKQKLQAASIQAFQRPEVKARLAEKQRARREREFLRTVAWG